MNQETIKIIRVPILPMNMVNAFVVCAAGGCILVDAGLPNSEAKFEAILKREGLQFSDIKLLVITHAHIDHAGNAARMRELTGAPILGHTNDLVYFRGKEKMTFCSTGWVGKVFLKTGLPQSPYRAFEPDILLSDKEEFDLKSFGLQARVISTPGHTAGSISVISNDGVAIVGDLVASGILLGGIAFSSIPKRPPFEDDPYVVAQELERIIDLGAQDFYMGHGGPLKRKAVEKHVFNLRKL